MVVFVVAMHQFLRHIAPARLRLRFKVIAGPSSCWVAPWWRPGESSTPMTAHADKKAAAALAALMVERAP
jgi:hypothetical protein